ncbi:MAG: restriction endonuclease subunit S [Spiribacter salinus]|uniref:Restriction endonuclease subunit S n=1 Tax=Spiribacter salinus TaxID=1335746 RepID=A0A540VMV5_9GAMM|nr:MAG: restriction endonuclease subunit S [Spiribacter salinus]
MREWCQLNEVAEINPDTLPGNTDNNFSFRYIHLGAVDRGTIDWNLTTVTRFGDAPSRARRIVQPGDTLFGTVRPNLQSHGYIEEKHNGATVASTGFCVVRPYQAKAVGRYLFHSLMSESVYAQSIKAAIGSNYPAITDRDLQGFKIFLPRLDEQSQIAHILDTLDTEIRRTEEIIAKLEQVKQGLLTDLLTRGIDQNGELRPSPEEAPHRYKDSPLGRIPKEWVLRRLSALAETIIDGAHHTPAYSETGVPFLRVTDVQAEQIDLSAARRVSLSEHRQLAARCAPRRGDILLSKNGTVGIAKVVDWDWPFSIFVSLSLIRLRPDSGLKADFAESVINSPVIAQQIARRSKQGTVTNLHLEEIREFDVPVPPKDEQDKIVDCVRYYRRRLGVERSRRRKLSAQKSGLMEDLLTGRVRVDPLLDEPERATG